MRSSHAKSVRPEPWGGGVEHKSEKLSPTLRIHRLHGGGGGECAPGVGSTCTPPRRREAFEERERPTAPG